jgi:hypothetical protein
VLSPQFQAPSRTAHRRLGFLTPAAVSPATCDEIAGWLQPVALAFLDGHERQDAFARQWLQSNNISIASRGSAEWSRK